MDKVDKVEQRLMEIVARWKGNTKKEARNAAAAEALSIIERRTGIEYDELCAMSAKLRRRLSPQRADATQINSLLQIESGSFPFVEFIPSFALLLL